MKRHKMERVQKYELASIRLMTYERCSKCGLVSRNPFRAMLDDMCN